jgi:hypothetical protein
VARWDGTSWSGFGSGIGGGVYGYVLAVTVYNGDLIAGGIYTTAGGVPANNIAKWDGYAWSPLGSGTFNGASTSGVYTVTACRTDLVAGGIFSSAGGVGAGNIASWNEYFSAFGNGCPGTGGMVPVLAGVGYPGPNSSAGVSVTNGRPLGTGGLFLATASGSMPVLGCSFLLGGLIFPPIPVALDASGSFGVTWPIPGAAATGVQVFFQYAGDDPGAPNGLFSASNGLRVTIQ